MAGVVINGVQYERCCQCGCSVPYDELEYATLAPHLTPKWPEYGHHRKLDLCSTCAGEEHTQPHDKEST